MKIGLDATPLVDLSGGIGCYIFYLLDQLIPLAPGTEFILYAPSDKGDIAHFKKYKNAQIRSIPFLSSCHSLWGQTTLSFLVSVLV